MRSERSPAWLRLLAPAVLILPAVLAPTSPEATFGRVYAGDVALVLVCAVVVALRRWRPRFAVGASIALCVVSAAVAGPLVASLTAVLVVVFSVARHTDRRTALWVGLAAALVVGATAYLLVATEWGGVRSLVQVVAMIGFAAAAGDAARSRHAYVEAITERARRAEEGLESEARRRVAEERLTIARDLHDVVAHQIAVINLQAGVASSALKSRPEEVERSLRAIREAARTVLGEIGDLLRVLRAADTAVPGPSAAVAPVPGLGQLEQLVDDFARSGLDVDLRLVGSPVALPETVDVAAYRVVQEGLTNAHKHGSDASALLHVQYAEDELEIVVVNAVGRAGRSTGHQGGHGLLGAHERVAAVHGRLEASYGPGQVHRLTAHLPLQPAGTP